MFRETVTRRTAISYAVLTATGALTLAACGGSDAGEGSTDLSKNRTGAMADFAAGRQFKATKPLSLSLLYSNANFYPLKKDWLLWSEITKRTNITLQPTVVPASDYESKRSLLIGAGDAPFIIPKTYPGQETPFVGSNSILPVSDYVSLMPNFQDKVKKWGLDNQLDTLRQDNGKYYVLPGLHQDVWQDYSIAVRTDILQQLNLKVPTTWDELHDVLAAMKKAYPNSYPMSDRWSTGSSTYPVGPLLSILGVAFGTNAGWNYGDGTTWDPAAKKFVISGTMNQYQQMLQYLNRLVKDGLLDPESFTQSDDQAIQKFANGKSFVISSNAQSLVNDYRPALAKTQPEATVLKIPVPLGPTGEVKAWSRLENGIMISAQARKSPDFVAMMQFIDWLWYSDAGEEFAKWGVPGLTYSKDASGRRTLAPDVDYVGLNPKATKHLQKDFGFSNGVFAYGGPTDLLQSTFSPEEVAFQKVMDARQPIAVPPAHPFTEEEQEQATLLQAPLKDFVAQQSLQFILGKRDFGQWNAYVSQVNAKGGSRFIDLANQAYQRFEKNHG
jgi:putative aldouronate transport system substrate-binding protein